MSTMFTLALALFGSAAWAQEDLEGGRDEARRDSRSGESEVVREIVRGYYLKGGAGITTYALGPSYGGILNPVMSLNLAVGSDFVDKERISLAWEVVLNQSLQNGPKFDELGSLPASGLPLIQGDIHTFAGLALFEASSYLSRRFGLGIRAGGGVMVAPVLMYDSADEVGYTVSVVNGEWGGAGALVHNGPLPVIAGGPTIEYYTKLSHFSLGLDVDVQYVINLDLGISPYGYLKYTF